MTVEQRELCIKAKKWIEEYILEKQRKKIEVKLGTNCNIYMDCRFHTGNMVEKFLIIFPQFHIWNIGMYEGEDHFGITFTLYRESPTGFVWY